MAYRTILAVNFDEERLRLLKHVGLAAQAKVRAVGEDEKDKTVGELIGLTEDETAEISALAQDTIEGTAIPDDAEPVMKEAVILFQPCSTPGRDLCLGGALTPVINTLCDLTLNDSLHPRKPCHGKQSSSRRCTSK